MCTVYVIKDEEGNYPTSCAFTKTDNSWFYMAVSGYCRGFVWYNTILTAQDTYLKLQKINKKYKFKKNFEIANIDLKKIDKGNVIIKRIII